MMFFAVGIELPNDVTVQRPHDADPGQHRRAAGLCNEDQRLHGSLPFGRGVLRLRQLSDVVGGVAIDQYAEKALGNRDYFLNKPYGVG